MKKTHWFTLTLAIALLLSLLAGLPASAHVAGLPLQGPDSANAGGPVGYPFNISNQSVDAQEPAVAYNPDRGEYLVVWYNDRSGNDDIQAQRVSRDGTLEGPAFYISGGPGAERCCPDVVYNSDVKEYLVVWEHFEVVRQILARPVSGTGQLLRSEVTVASSAVTIPSDPAVAYASMVGKYLVVWGDEGTGASSIRGQVLNGDGTLSGAGLTISQDPGGNERYLPDVAYNRSRDEYLVVWQQKAPAGAVQDFDIYARRVQGNGILMFPASIGIWTGDDQHQHNPAVAAIATEPNQGHYLVVWADYTSTGGKIVGASVSGDTVFVLLMDISIAPEEQHRPAVAGYEGTQEYLVVWHQYYPGPPAFPVPAGVKGVTLSIGGAPPSDETWLWGAVAARPAVASGPVGDFLVVHEDMPVVAALSEQPSALTRNIYGQLWGNRLHLPVILKNK